MRFQEDGHVSHLPWDLMRYDTDRHGKEFIRVSKAEGNTNGKPIDEVMKQWSDKIQKPCWFLSLAYFALILLLL